MISKTEAKEIIKDLFEEEALAIGGIVAMHSIRDEVVWRLMRSLDDIRGKILRRLENSQGEEEREAERPNLNPHPAIEEFLLNLRRA